MAKQDLLSDLNHGIHAFKQLFLTMLNFEVKTSNANTIVQKSHTVTI